MIFWSNLKFTVLLLFSFISDKSKDVVKASVLVVVPISSETTASVSVELELHCIDEFLMAHVEVEHEEKW